MKNMTETLKKANSPKEPQILDGEIKENVFGEIAKLKDYPIPISFESGGSNPFLVVATNEFLRGQGYRVARLSDFFQQIYPEFYFDTSLVLRDREKTPHGQDLLMQVMEIENIGLPLKIDLADLTLDKKNFGWGFKLMENSKIYYASIFGKKNGTFCKKDIDRETGLPKQLSPKGSIQLFNQSAHSSDISRLIVKETSINSNYHNLFYSYSAGRILIVEK